MSDPMDKTENIELTGYAITRVVAHKIYSGVDHVHRDVQPILVFGIQTGPRGF